MRSEPTARAGAAARRAFGSVAYTPTRRADISRRVRGRVSGCARCPGPPRRARAASRSRRGRCVGGAAAVRIDVLAEQRHLPHALEREVGDLGQHVVERPRHLLAARVRHDAERAVLAAALHDRHERRGAVDTGRRQVVELLDLGERDVDLRAAALARARISAAGGAASAGRTRRRRRVARRTIASPSWLATQPPTPMIRSGRSRFSSRTRPRSWNTRSCAFSRTEHVLNRMTSASSGRSVAERPSLSASTSAMRSESYSFHLHPKVRM